MKRLPDNKYETFKYLCALNLLNSLIKTPCFKHEIQYKEIKLKVSDLIAWCSTDSRAHLLDSLCHNTKERCTYVRCYGLQFSFHGVAISRILDFINPNNRIEKWDGIRLQPIAVKLFTISLSSNENTVALEINRLLNQLYDI